MDPDPGNFFADKQNSFNKKLFSNFLFYFFAYFYPKTFYNLTFFKISDLGFRSKKVLCFWLMFYPLDQDPWIRIFLRIRILSTAVN